MTTPASAAKVLIEAALAWYVCECPAEVANSYHGCIHQAEMVEAISAYRRLDPTGSILARQAEIGAAVERLPKARRWAIELVPMADPEQDWLTVWEFRVTRPDGEQFYAPTLPAAIAAALGETT